MTALLSGSGGFLSDEDLKRETPDTGPNCWSRELPGLREGLKVEDIRTQEKWKKKKKKKEEEEEEVS